MFIGHYAAAFAARAWQRPDETGRQLGLGGLFVAAQAVDIGFFCLVGLGVEHARANPDLPGFTPVDFYHMPFTHSLPATFLWALILGGLVGRFWGKASGLAFGLVVASHWFLDLPVHRPDLGLWWNDFKVGFSLWNVPISAAALELTIIAVSFALYWHKRRLEPVRPILPLCALIGFLALSQAINWTSPAPQSIPSFALTGLLAYGAAAALAAWADRPAGTRPSSGV